MQLPIKLFPALGQLFRRRRNGRTMYRRETGQSMSVHTCFVCENHLVAQWTSYHDYT